MRITVSQGKTFTLSDEAIARSRVLRCAQEGNESGCTLQVEAPAFELWLSDDAVQALDALVILLKVCLSAQLPCLTGCERAQTSDNASTSRVFKHSRASDPPHAASITFPTCSHLAAVIPHFSPA
jgi:hypothetical protein